MQIRELIKQAMASLKAQGVESARLESELLMMHVTKFTQVQLLTHDLEPLPALDETVYKALVEQRLQGTPIAYILGERDFWDLTLKVTPDTLIPRPDTELLVEKALTLINCNHCRDVLDLGTGTGAIILALKHSAPEINATAVDSSPHALEVAMENAQRYNLEVEFLCGSWFEPLSAAQQGLGTGPDDQNQGGQGSQSSPNKQSNGRSHATSHAHAFASAQGQSSRNRDANGVRQFDLIVSNPPYVEENDPHLQQGDVRFEPLLALAAGADGLRDLRQIIAASHAFLRPQGYLVLEHGYNQGVAVRDLLTTHGFAQVETLRDYGQNERVSLGRFMA